MWEHRAELAPYLRDATGHWFVWAFIGRSFIFLAKSQIPKSHADAVYLLILPLFPFFLSRFFLLLFFSPLFITVLSALQCANYMEHDVVWGLAFVFCFSWILLYTFWLFSYLQWGSHDNLPQQKKSLIVSCHFEYLILFVTSRLFLNFENLCLYGYFH